MLGFTVNTDILMIASGTSDKARDPDRKRACIQLLKWMQITAGCAAGFGQNSQDRAGVHKQAERPVLWKQVPCGDGNKRQV